LLDPPATCLPHATAVRRQQRPVDEVANLSALIEGEWVKGHRERSWGAVSCAAVAKLRGARALEESF
jgi:hypothetical protein